MKSLLCVLHHTAGFPCMPDIFCYKNNTAGSSCLFSSNAEFSLAILQVLTLDTSNLLTSFADRVTVQERSGSWWQHHQESSSYGENSAGTVADDSHGAWNLARQLTPRRALQTQNKKKNQLGSIKKLRN